MSSSSAENSCSLSFLTFDICLFQVTLKSGASRVDLSLYRDSSVWSLKDTSLRSRWTVCSVSFYTDPVLTCSKQGKLFHLKLL